MKKSLIAAIIIGASLGSLRAADWQQLTEQLERRELRPVVQLNSDELFIQAPDSHALLVMNVRIYTLENELVLSHRSLGEAVSINSSELSDGTYKYETVAVLSSGPGEEDQHAQRHFGQFTIAAGEFLVEPTPSRELSQRLQHGLGELISWLVPTAQAATFQELTIEDTIPRITLVRTDAAGNPLQTLFEMAGTEERFSIYDFTSSSTLLSIAADTDNRNSFIVDQAGDLSLADSAVVIDRSLGRLGIGTSAPSADLDISAISPTIELRDETDQSASWIKYASGSLLLEGVDGQNIVSMHAGAPANSLRITGQGRIGIGTATPGEELELYSVDPRIQLTDPSNATFSLGEDSNNFTIAIDQNPFGGPVGSILTLDSTSGYFGLYNKTPEATFTVGSRDGRSAKILVENTTSVAQPRTLFELRNAGNTKFSLTNTQANVEWSFANAGSAFRVSRQSSGEVEFNLLNNGNLEIAGILKENSDRHAKTNITAIDPSNILEKVITLPIQRWQYKDAPGEDHIGPMAQDFYAAFGLGDSATQIATLDSAGVALAAIQALAQQADPLTEYSQQLLRKNEQLLAEVIRLEAEIEQLQQQQQRIVALERAVIQWQAETQSKETWRAAYFEQEQLK